MGLFFFGRIFFLVDAKQMFARLGGSGTEGCRTCWAAETVPAWKEVPTDVRINQELDSTNFKASEQSNRSHQSFDEQTYQPNYENQGNKINQMRTN